MQNHACDCRFCKGLHFDQHREVQAVIEAAKALYSARQLRYGKARDDREDVALFAIDESVNALLAAEGE